MTDFIAFYEDRRDQLRGRLRQLLGAATSATEPAASHDGDSVAEAVDEGPDSASEPVGPMKSRRRYGSQMEDLLEAGVVVPGERLTGGHRGNTYEFTVLPDGRLDDDGTVYDSPSQAARLMSGQAAVNDWAFWHTESGDPVGDRRPG